MLSHKAIKLESYVIAPKKHHLKLRTTSISYRTDQLSYLFKHAYPPPKLPIFLNQEANSSTL